MDQLFPVRPILIVDTNSIDIRDALNEQRMKYGFVSLKLDTSLSSIAQSWAETMAKQNRLYHGDFSGRISHVFPNTEAGENIDVGDKTVINVVSDWMNSVPHRSNILGPYTLLGVGRATAKNREIYWVIDFDNPNNLPYRIK